MPPKSDVWRHFTKESKDKVRCNLCMKIFVYCGSSSSMGAHLKKIHNIGGNNNTGSSRDASSSGTVQRRVAVNNEDPDDPEIQISEPSTNNQEKAVSTNNDVPKRIRRNEDIDKCFERASSFSDGGHRAAKMTDAVLFMMARDNMPFSTVENEGFKYLMKTAVPLYRLPSRKTATRLMEDKYESLKRITKEKLKEVERLCLTCDIWTETMSTKSYLGLTAHFQSGTVMEAATIGVTPLETNHTSAYIGAKLREMCDEWDIDICRVTAVVTDGGLNMKNAAKEVFGAAKHITCFAHTLNLIPQDAFKKTPGLQELIQKVKDIIRFFKQSVVAADALRKVQMAAGKKESESLKLKQDVPTRWSATFLMLERFIELYKAVSDVLFEIPHAPNFISLQQLSTLKGVKAILAPLQRATTEMSAEKTVTLSKVIPVVCLVKKAITLVNPGTDPIVKTLQAAVLEQFKKRYDSVESVHKYAQATILDPRFKRMHFENAVPLANAITSVSDSIRRAVRMNNADAAQTQHAPAATTTSDEGDFWTIHESMVAVDTANQPEDNPGGIPVEFRAYLNKPVADRHQDLLVLWDSMKVHFPNVHEEARQHLHVLATSVPSERVFSKAGIIVTEKRTRLTPKHLSMMIFLESLGLDVWQSNSR